MFFPYDIVFEKNKTIDPRRLESAEFMFGCSDAD